MGILVNGTVDDDTIFGSDNDTLVANKDDTLNGAEGNDTIYGGSGNDVINGGPGSDSIDAGDGNDQIVLSAGDTFDVVDGGTGTDTLNATNVSVTGTYDFKAGTISGVGTGTVVNVENFLGANFAADIIISDGSGVFSGQGGDDTITGNIGVQETLYGGLGTDTLILTPYGGNYVVNMLTGGTNFNGESFVGFENLITGAGNDSLTGTSGGNMIDAGTGNDSLYGGLGDDTLTGGDGNDLLSGSTGVDDLLGGANNDTINGGTSTDNVLGGDGDDVILFNGIDFFDAVDGGGGRDTIDASASTVAGVFDFAAGVISGNGGGAVTRVEVFLGSVTLGDTVLSSGAGRFDGQGGDDTITAGSGAAETLDGGADRDTLISTDTANYAINLTTGVTSNAGESFVNFENLTMGAGNDTLTGSATGNTLTGGGGADRALGLAGGDRLNGGDGNDTLVGGKGNDKMIGGTGNDVLQGDAGTDKLTGNAGNDRFVFTAGFGTDTITDFKGGAGVADVLDFTALGITSAGLTISSANGGADTLITRTGFADTILLTGVAFGTLAGDDFVF